MELTEIKHTLTQVTDFVAIDNALKAILEMKNAERDFQNWTELEAEALYTKINTQLNGVQVADREAEDCDFFKLFYSLMKVYPVQSALARKGLVNSMTEYNYPEYYMDKCMAIIEMTRGIKYWPKSVVLKLSNNILKNAKKFDTNTDDEYGGSFYAALKVLDPLVDNPRLKLKLTKYHASENHPYQEKINVVKNFIWVYLISKQYEKIAPLFEENKDLILSSKENVNYTIHIYLAEAHQKLGNKDEMLSIINKTKEITIKEGRAYYFMAEEYISQGEKDKALAEFDKIYILRGEHVYVLEQKIKFCIKHKLHQELLDILESPLNFGWIKNSLEKYKTIAEEGLKN